MIKKLFTALCIDDNENSGNALFSCNEMGIDLNNINLDDTNYNEDDPETISYQTFGLTC